MKEEEFNAGIDAIILTGVKGHIAHRALDLWWTRYALELGPDNPVAIGTRKWMAHIEGDHAPGRTYPLGKKALRCRLGFHDYRTVREAGEHEWFDDIECARCRKKYQHRNPCP